jgi:hypothetical protein
MVAHANLTGANLHEPKGAASATANAAYIANGSGSGTWTVLKDLNKMYLTIRVDALQTAGAHWLVCPLAGNITKIYSVIDLALATGDATIQAAIGGTNLTNGLITITQSGSAAGDIDSCTPTALNSITAGGALRFTVAGTNTAAADATLTVEVTLT